jgi:hypothetical protein
LAVERGRELGQHGAAFGLGRMLAFLFAPGLVLRARSHRLAHPDCGTRDGAELVAALGPGHFRLDVAAGEALQRTGEAAERADDRARHDERRDEQNEADEAEAH